MVFCPLAVDVAPALQEIRVRERRFVRAVLDVVDDAERVEVDAEVQVEAVIEGEQFLAGEAGREPAVRLAHRVAVIPRLDHLGPVASRQASRICTSHFSTSGTVTPIARAAASTPEPFVASAAAASLIRRR